MGKAKKPRPIKLRKPMDPEKARRLRVAAFHLSLAIVLLGGLGAGYFYADRYVERNVATPSQPLIVVLKNRPAWMNDFLVEQIAMIARPVGPHSAFDRQLLVDTALGLKANPWVREVRSVRRAFTNRPGDTLEIDCEYRAPVALVKWGVFNWLVDEKGVRLSERFTEQDVPNIQFGPEHHTIIRVIEGVRHPAPHLAGEKWDGDDLAAGLKMVKYLFDRPYTEQILRVNVANYAGRVDNKDPQLVLITKYNTQIWWGRPPGDDDVDSFIEVSTARKMRYLQLTCEQFGRVDAKEQWLDIRFDKVGRPSPPPEAAPPPPVKGRRTAGASGGNH
jgi:hypothetical protein